MCLAIPITLGQESPFTNRMKRRPSTLPFFNPLAVLLLFTLQNSQVAVFIFCPELLVVISEKEETATWLLLTGLALEVPLCLQSNTTAEGSS